MVTRSGYLSLKGPGKKITLLLQSLSLTVALEHCVFLM